MFNSTLLDDPLVFDACASFDGGVVSHTRANLLAPNQLASLTNGDITAAGQIVTRRGSRRLGTGAAAGGSAAPIQGVAFYDGPGGGYLVAAAGGRLWRFNGDATGGDWTPLVSTIDGTPVPWRAADAARPVAFAQGADRLFFTDGAGSIHSWDGSVYADLSAVSADPDRRPPVGGLLVWHGARLCVAGVAAAPDAVYFSDPLLTPLVAGDPPWSNAAGHVRVGGGGGDPIVALVPWSDFNLVVLKRHSAWIVNTAGAGTPSAYPVNAISGDIGCVAALTAAPVGTDVWFLAADGVRSVRRTQATSTQQEVGDALSAPIQDVIARINPAAVGTSCAVSWGRRYLLAVPLDGASAPNAVLVCDTQTQKWTGQWLGWRPLAWAVSAFGGDLRLCFGQVNGIVSEWLDHVPAAGETAETFTDDGAPIATTLRTRAMTFGQAHCPKTGFQYEAEFNESQAAATVRAILDDADVMPGDGLATGPAARVLPVGLPFALPRGGIVRRALDLQRFGGFRELQFEVASPGGKLALRGISASAFVDSVVVQG